MQSLDLRDLEAVEKFDEPFVDQIGRDSETFFTAENAPADGPDLLVVDPTGKGNRSVEHFMDHPPREQIGDLAVGLVKDLADQLGFRSEAPELREARVHVIVGFDRTCVIGRLNKSHNDLRLSVSPWNCRSPGAVMGIVLN